MDTNTTIADQNTERLIEKAYQPDAVPAVFAADLGKLLSATAHGLAQQPATLPTPPPINRWRLAALVLGGIAAGLLILFALSGSPPPMDGVPRHLPPRDRMADIPVLTFANWTDDARDGMKPRQRPDAPALSTLKKGESLSTKAGQRKLVQLADGTRLFVNEKTEVEASGDRQLTLHRGQVYLEVAPKENSSNFIVKAGTREMTATGTHFGVQSDAALIVTQGSVAVKDTPAGKDKAAIEVTAGQRLEPGADTISAALRASHTLEWTRELMAAAESPMVPGCQHAGGALLALDPQGQEIKLALRQYHIDVHIEDGFARTTIDQTYFNTTWKRLEGTFYFPLPPDASLSRLAMYVADANNQCKLMEGGMAERKHAADVYETIRYQRRDPALLEWLDGSTFKMRVFPLEAKQEKRIILSYTQKLPSLYGNTRYRFPGGHNMPMVRNWSFTARIKSGAGMVVSSPSHENMHRVPQTGDVLMTIDQRNIKPEQDVILDMQEPAAVLDQDVPRFATFLYENHQYLMLRYRPSLPTVHERKRRDWIILFEASAQRDPLLAGTQVDVVKQLLKNAEYDDTFTLMSVNSKVNVFDAKPQPARPANVAEGIKFLQKAHLVGALDLKQGLDVALRFAKDVKNPHLVHIGSGTPAMGERDAGKLAQTLPASVTYVGIGVGKRWNRSFMKLAAERTGGLFTQINPDEVIAWRAFDLLSTLNTPRLLDVHVMDARDQSPTRFLLETTMLSQGEEICALARVDTNKNAIPGKVIVKGILSPLPPGEGPGVRGKAFVKEFPVINVQPGAGYLPRTWAKQEIDRLLAENAAKHKNEIISLSKAMYVMSPFTSLLVLETDADYEKYKVDKGRKDHWAMYTCPPKIPLVYEPDGQAPPKEVKIDKKNKRPSADEVLGTMLLPVPDGGTVYLGGITEARTGSLMLGGGVSSNNGMVGSVVLNERQRRAQVLFEKRAIAKEEYLAILSDRGKLDPMDPARPRPMNGEVFSLGRGLDQQQSAQAGRSLKRPPQFQETIAVFGRPVKVEIGKKTEIAKDISDLSDFIGWRGFQANTKGSDPQDEWRRFWMNDQPDGLTPVRIHGGDENGRIQFAPVSVSPQMSWAMPALPAPAIAGLPPGGSLTPELRIPMRNSSFDFENEFGLEFGLQMMSRNVPLGKVTNVSKDVTTTRVTHHKVTTPQFGTDGRPSDPSFRYERPTYNYDRTLFTDLVQYAPGLHTAFADVLGTLEAEAEAPLPKVGTIDAAARQLIDKARPADWSTLSISEQGPIPGYKIAFNGLGHFTYERILMSGLREQVVCDGKTLWHLYPEIGLGAKRPMTRHHLDVIAAINPAFLPSADELVRGVDVKAIDALTVALSPLTPGPSPGGRGEKMAGEGEKYHRVHLVFAKDGRLAERQIVEMPANKIIVRQMYQADGSVEWKDAEDKSLAKQARSVAPAQAPNLTPNVSELVVMTLPLRTRNYWLDQWSKEEKPYFIEQAIVTECLSRAGGANVLIHIGTHFHQKGDRRLGFYTLLNAAGYQYLNENMPPIDKQAWTIDIEKEHPQSALATFLAQCQHETRQNDNTDYKLPAGAKDGFIPKLAHFRKLWRAWQHQRPLMDSAREMPIAKSKVTDFLKETTSPVFAYALFDAMQRRCNTPPTDYMLELAVKRFEPVSDPLGLGYVFKYEHARSVWQSGRVQEANTLFKELHATTLEYGVLPPIDPAFRDAMQTPVGDGPKFIPYTRKALDDVLGKKNYRVAFQFARQMEQLGDEALADEILTTILAKASAEERNLLTLVCVNVFSQRKNFAQADRLLVKVLEDKKLAEAPGLWRWRSAVTKEAGQAATSIACLEKALDLEYADLPELVNLEGVRADYGTLLAHYQKIAEASASLEKSATKTFLAKVIRTADRWRLIDPEHSASSTLAGKILHTMGERELAWDYWTTPIDLHPAESRPWLELADTMKAEGDLEKADRALGIAFEAEATNPEILWKRAQNAVRMGQPERARQFYRQIADSDWQERFQGTVEQARGLAGR